MCAVVWEVKVCTTQSRAIARFANPVVSAVSLVSTVVLESASR